MQAELLKDSTNDSINALRAASEQRYESLERMLELQVRDHLSIFCGALWTPRCHLPCHVTVL